MNRVLHVSANSYPPLDQFHFTKRIWLELATQAEEYHVIARGSKSFWRMSHYKEGKLHLHLVPSWGKRERSFILSSFYIIPIILKYRIDRMIAQSPLLGGFSAALASVLFRIPLMVEIHGQHYFTYLQRKTIIHRMMAALISFSLKRASVIRALNKQMEETIQHFGYNRTRIIPNRVDTQLFFPPKQNYTLGKDIQIVSVGRFVSEKNYLSLLACLATWKQPWKLTLIGGGPLRNDLESEIHQLQIQDKVSLIDWLPQNQLIAFLTQSDVYIQSSTAEALPRSLLEAMAAALPCVSTDAGFISGTISHGENGLIVSKSLQNLIPALEHLLYDETMRTQLGNQARRDILQHYEWNQCFTKYREVLYSI
ncbi:MAG: glycosyltransferase family 4 protein [Saprospiraceae bacterium]|nr:glycosyltransferase family 4 protein [Saprospiraceae bacterium]